MRSLLTALGIIILVNLTLNASFKEWLSISDIAYTLNALANFCASLALGFVMGEWAIETTKKQRQAKRDKEFELEVQGYDSNAFKLHG